MFMSTRVFEFNSVTTIAITRFLKFVLEVPLMNYSSPFIDIGKNKYIKSFMMRINAWQILKDIVIF